MADTKHHAGHTGPAPVEGDGVSYSGIVWFVVILAATTVFCMAIVWGMFEWMAGRADALDGGRPAIAGPATTPSIANGQIVGSATRPGPALLVVEPAVLKAHREREAAELATYGWMDRNAGTVRIPIDRAKDLVLERGLPAR